MFAGKNNKANPIYFKTECQSYNNICHRYWVGVMIMELVVGGGGRSRDLALIIREIKEEIF